VYLASRLIFVVLDGTLVGVHRIAKTGPTTPEQYKRHGLNVQVLADTSGRLLLASPALPGAVHDVRVGPERASPAALVKTDLYNARSGVGGERACDTLWGSWNCASVPRADFSA
jgi:hypothetical protein